MKKKIYILFLIGCTYCNYLKAQDPQFSQFYSNPMYLAPSFAGLIEDSRIAANYRIQWPALAHPYKSYSLALDHNFYTFNSGAAVFFMKDEAGTGNLTSTNIGLQYAYEIKISDYWYIRPGVHFLYSERRLDFTKLLWADQISASGNAPISSELSTIEKAGDIDFSTSAMAYSDQFWFGFSVDHLLKPNQSLTEFDGNDGTIGYVPIKYSFFGGTKIINRGRLYRPYDASLQIAFLYKKQEYFNQLDLGLYWYNKPLVLGMWYRGLPKLNDHVSRDAVTLLLGFKLDYINIGYSYDFSISRLIGASGGSHEISFYYHFKTKVTKRKLRIVPCPHF